MRAERGLIVIGIIIAVEGALLVRRMSTPARATRQATARRAIHHDLSTRLSSTWVIADSDDAAEAPEGALAPPQAQAQQPIVTPVITVPQGSAAIEQTTMGTKPPARLVANFDGLGADFTGPQGTAPARNPSDNSIAVGRDHVMQIVNSRTAIFTKTGKALYGPVPTSNVFRGFGGTCEIHNNGDAVARYDQLADRWLIVMPIFRRDSLTIDPREVPKSGDPIRTSVPGMPRQPGSAAPLYQPPPPPPADTTAPARGRGAAPPQPTAGAYAMCYAVSTGPDPLGSYYRYEFVRPLFPDYPRPAVWPDGYYIPTSTSDNFIQKQACVAERAKMLKGEDASEQCVIIDDVNFLNNADLDGKQLPPAGAPNVMLAAGGAQLKGVMEDDGIYAWTFHVDWADVSKTKIAGPVKIPVVPYHYLCDGQLTNCVPQPGTDRRLDSQGDKIMARVAYRRIGDHELLVAAHSVNTSAGGGGVRWYQLEIDRNRAVRLTQQGTYAPGGMFRWMASPAMDAMGNIGIGYSFGGLPNFAGQRFAGRLAGDPPGTLTLVETVLVTGEAAQTNTLRWEDYSQTAVDPSDDCTIWYVGDYLKAGATGYSTRIGAFRFPDCGR